MGELEKKISAVRLRLKLFRLVDWCFWALLAGLTVLALAMLTLKFFPDQEVPLPMVAGGIIGIALLGAMIIALAKKLTLFEAALQADSRLNLRERLSSAILLHQMDRTNQAAYDALEKDARDCARAIQPGRDFKYKFPRQARHLLWPLIAIAVLNFIPPVDLFATPPPPRTPIKTTTLTEEERQERAQELKELAQKIRNKEEELEAVDEDLQLANKLERLSEDLSLGRKSEREVAAEMSRMNDQMKSMEREISKRTQSFKQIKGLQQAKHTKSLRRDLKNQDFKQAAAKLNDLAKKMQSENPPPPQELKEMAKELEDLAEQVKENKEMANAMQQAAQAMQQAAQQQQQQQQQQSQQQQSGQQSQQQQGQQSQQNQGQQGQQQQGQQGQQQQQQSGQQQQNSQQQQSQQSQSNSSQKQCMSQACQSLQQAASSMQNMQQMMQQAQSVSQMQSAMAGGMNPTSQQQSGQGQKSGSSNQPGQRSQSQGQQGQGQQGQQGQGQSKPGSCQSCGGGGCKSCGGTGKQPGQGSGQGQWQAGQSMKQGNGSGGPGQGRGGNPPDSGATAQQYKDVFIPGEKNDGEIIAVFEVEAPAERGESNVRYTSAPASYQQQAADTIVDQEIPAGMRNAVRDYFSTINQTENSGN